jgi:ankyrin repeat protein
LLNSGAPINAQDQEGTTALMSALESREVAKLLLTRGADVTLRTKDGATALLYAAGRNVPWLIKPLIERGADVNARNGRGQTPLMWATGAIDWVAKPEVMHALIDSGADVNLADRDGNTALMFAALQGLTNSASILLQAHAQTAIRNKGGQTALDIAKKARREGVVKLLSGAH